MPKLTEKEQAFLEYMVKYINDHIPNRDILSNASESNFQDQIISIIRHEISGYFSWYLSDITATMTLQVNGDVTYNWGSNERGLDSAKSAVSLYKNVVDFGEQLERILKTNLTVVKAA